MTPGAGTWARVSSAKVYPVLFTNMFNFTGFSEASTTDVRVAMVEIYCVGIFLFVAGFFAKLRNMY